MPLYDYQCPVCGITFEQVAKYEDRTVECKECHSNSFRVVSPMRNSQIDIFKEGYYEELGDDNEGRGPHITSKEHMARECEKRGLYSRAIMESMNGRHYGRRREI